MGIDMLNPADAQPWGNLANSLSGRGDLGKLNFAGDFLNRTLFSARYLKSNIDVFTAPIKAGFGELQVRTGVISRSELLARREAAKNTLRLVAGVAVILTIAKIIDPESVTFDPRSTDFGKIKVGATRFDVTGGLASIATLASRLAPTEHNGVWGWWKVDSKGRYKLIAKLEGVKGPELFKIGEGTYGDSALEALGGFITNKSAVYQQNLTHGVSI